MAPVVSLLAFWPGGMQNPGSPDQESVNPTAPALEGDDSTSGPPGESLFSSSVGRERWTVNIILEFFFCHPKIMMTDP